MSRWAGVVYLVIVITGMFSLAYVPGQLFIWDNPEKTFSNIQANEGLLRLSIAVGVICYIAFTILPLLLYRLLRPVNEWYARIMVVLALISVPISFLNLQHKYAVLDLLNPSKQAPGQPLSSLYQETMNYLNHYNDGIHIVTVFWGLWLLPFGYLVYRSGILPKFLGILLMLGCLGYMVNFFGNTLIRDYRTIGISSYFGLLPAIGEIGTCLWLLLVGARESAKT
ncbi:DUF4386 domain-containing protein [Flavihumibacter rivuli]|uniref:DUF4386 domain-containing protein n=1 Tax=Flavihumibacter rivuli TaxID=2838156 RepID=UPI001BDE0036|nr:DUF4386 domain-containing protein [Flavihumibacter rivuli]ULQ55238.1 DUF4386 domain-containing protein [Flavihumibacter rivuli]